MARKAIVNGLNDIIAQSLADQLRATLPAERIRCNRYYFGMGEIMVLNRLIRVYVDGLTVRLRFCWIRLNFGDYGEWEEIGFDLADPDSIEKLLAEVRWVVAYQQHLSDVLFDGNKIPILVEWAKRNHRDYEWLC